MKIHLAPGLALTGDAATETFAILARKDGGKTYAGLKLFEEMHAAGAQCVAVDPVGKWWSLRLAADGKSPGIDLPIFGGLYADLPLEPTAGALIAQVIVDRGISAVIDVSLFEDRDMKRFVTDFAKELYRLKQRNQSVLHLFVEEASTFLPQDKEDGNDPPMLNAMKKIVRKGRNYGIGSTMIDQRAQDVNKKVLNQASVLVVLGTSGSTDRKAIETWIRDKHIDVSGLDELASLEQGEAFVWLPREKTFKRVHIAKRWTFDASATPKLGAVRKERKLAPADVSALREAMAESVKRAEADDPKMLRKRIAELEKQVLSKTRIEDQDRIVDLQQQLCAAQRAPKVVEKSVVKTEQIARLERTGQHLNNVAVAIKTQVDELLNVVAKVSAVRNGDGMRDEYDIRGGQRGKYAARYTAGVTTPAQNEKAIKQALREVATLANGGLPKGEEKILAALIQFPDGLAREQLTVLTGYKRSTRDAYIYRLCERGYASAVANNIIATPAGIAALPNARPLPTGEALIDYWRGELPAGERAIFDELVAAHGSAVACEMLTERTGYKRSTRDAYLYRLAAKQLVVRESGAVRASENLFLQS